MEKFILVPYELQGKNGKIVVKDGKTEEEIKEFCVINSLEKDIKELSKKVNLGGKNGKRNC